MAKRLGWLTYDQTKKTYGLSPNFQYSLYDKHAKKMTMVSNTELGDDHLWTVPSVLKDLLLSPMAEWKFQNLNRAFEEAITPSSRTLLLYLDVVGSNIIGDAVHPLVREVHCQRSDGDGVFRTIAHSVVAVTLSVLG